MQQTMFNLAVYSGPHLSAGCCHAASPPPSPTDYRPPTPTVVTEVTCGEQCRKAFCTCALATGSLVSVASPAVSLSGNCRHSLSTVCGKLTPTCHHWEVVKLDKRKVGHGGGAGPLTMRMLSNVSVVNLAGYSGQRITHMRLLKTLSKGRMLSRGFRPWPATSLLTPPLLRRRCVMSGL